jgi:hypothetical protein
LLTGVYGAWKSTLVAEIAAVIEERGEPYAAIDLDWLGWFHVGWDDDARAFALVAENLRQVSANYVAAGAPTRFDVRWCRCRPQPRPTVAGFEDHRVTNDRAVRLVAHEALARLGWPSLPEARRPAHRYESGTGPTTSI